MKTYYLVITILIGISSITAQDSQVHLLNTVIEQLQGEIPNEEIPVFTTIKEVCDSRYITCDRQRQIIGLDFQFANLNGALPADIAGLTSLEYINLEYNYLDGTVPEGLVALTNLQELLLNGNFMTGPLPADLKELSRQADIDLSQNTIRDADKRSAKRYNITNQFNLQGCRSPDSIFLDYKMAQERAASATFDTAQAVTPKEDEEFKVVETMPRFPGCEDEELSDKEKEDCAKQTMLEFIYSNLRYPAEARENNIDGMVVSQFLILKNGDIGQAQITRDIGSRCGNAVLWIINRMNYTCDKWVPGSQRGEPVKVQYTLPVRFRLE